MGRCECNHARNELHEGFTRTLQRPIQVLYQSHRSGIPSENKLWAGLHRQDLQWIQWYNGIEFQVIKPFCYNLANQLSFVANFHLTSRMEYDRVKYIWSHRWSKTYQQTILYNTGKLKEPYKYSNLTFFKGETHGFFSSEMTEYLVESKHGINFLEWCKDTGHASEHYWNTLNYNAHLNTPGGYTG